VGAQDRDRLGWEGDGAAALGRLGLPEHQHMPADGAVDVAHGGEGLADRDPAGVQVGGAAGRQRAGRRRRHAAGVAALSRYQIRHHDEFSQQVTQLPSGVTRWLAEVYTTLRETPHPGQSALEVRPHPWVPNAYTVPFLDGRLVYAVGVVRDQLGDL
jgi:hypothetical protein